MKENETVSMEESEVVQWHFLSNNDSVKGYFRNLGNFIKQEARQAAGSYDPAASPNYKESSGG